MQIHFPRLLCTALSFLAELGFFFGIFLMLATKIGLGNEHNRSECSILFKLMQINARAKGNAPEQTQKEALDLDKRAQEITSAARGEIKKPVVLSKNLLDELTKQVNDKKNRFFEKKESVFQMTTGNGKTQRIVTDLQISDGKVGFRDLKDNKFYTTDLTRITELFKVERPESITNPKFIRNYPPASSVDTIMDGKFRNQVEISFISDAEIREVHKPKEKATLKQETTRRYEGSSLEIGLNESGKAIIQQQALRGCTAAVAAMLIRDNGRPVDLHDLRSTNLGNENSMANTIEYAGLKPISTAIPGNMEKLQELISKNGPAIVSVGGEIGGHVIIVDAIDLNAKTARIRDPFHGWDITIDLNALQSRISKNSSIIQVKKAP